MLKQAEKFKEEDKKRRELVDLKNEAHSVYETTKRQLDEFRSRIPNDVAENIEKALATLS
jgi:molecular chaperone DnaK